MQCTLIELFRRFRMGHRTHHEKCCRPNAAVTRYQMQLTHVAECLQLQHTAYLLHRNEPGTVEFKICSHNAHQMPAETVCISVARMCRPTYLERQLELQRQQSLHTTSKGSLVTSGNDGLDCLMPCVQDTAAVSAQSTTLSHTVAPPVIEVEILHILTCRQNHRLRKEKNVVLSYRHSESNLIQLLRRIGNPHFRYHRPCDALLNSAHCFMHCERQITVFKC
eukprot:SAG31_NODE_4819_length_2933_cov_1.577629_2_plen_222_part_00